MMSKDKPSAVGGGSGPSSSSSSSSVEGLTLKLFEPPKPQQLSDGAAPSSTLDSFTMPASPPYLRLGSQPDAQLPTSETRIGRKASTLTGASLALHPPSAILFEPLFIPINVSRKAPAHPLVCRLKIQFLSSAASYSRLSFSGKLNAERLEEVFTFHA